LLLMTRIQSSGLSTSICKASRLSLLDKRHGLVYGVPQKKHHPYYSSFVAKSLHRVECEIGAQCSWTSGVVG
jgi:hypothetical protein